jgi:hypothetical protein
MAQSAFPDRTDSPTLSSKGINGRTVPCAISQQLRVPEIPVRFRKSIVRTLSMGVPKATVNKDHRPILGDGEVRSARKPFVMQPVAEPCPPKRSSNCHLRRRVSRSNRRHVSGPCWRYGLRPDRLHSSLLSDTSSSVRFIDHSEVHS